MRRRTLSTTSSSLSPYKKKPVRPPRIRALASPRRSTVKIEPGLRVPVTKELVTFWQFAAERHAIYIKRTKGEPRP